MRSEKVTNARSSETKRGYGDACGTAHGLELVGERWALLVLRELMLGPRRFSQLRADLPGISANVLTQRLAELEQRGLVMKRRLPPPTNIQVYEATDWGLEAEPIVQVLGRWAARSPRHDPTLFISGVSLMLSFKTMVDAKRAKGIDASIGFRFGDDTYVARLKKGRLKVRRARSDADFDRADVAFIGTPPMLAAVVYGGQSMTLVDVRGDRTLAHRFATLFPLPEKAEVAGH